MSEHTPGPWKCERIRDNIGRAYCTHYVAHIDCGVCMVWAPIGNKEQEANARLIAAAPDLLEACRYVLRQLETGERVRADCLIDAVEKATQQQTEKGA